VVVDAQVFGVPPIYAHRSVMPPISRGGTPVLPNSWSSPKILPTPFDVDQFRTDMGDRRRGNFEGTHDGNAVPIVKSLGNA